MTKLIIDSFAGGGGASTGIAQALGTHPHYAINHDPAALEMHAANHPETVHMVEDVWQVDIPKLVDDREVGLLWASPDCKHFSRAKGGKPVEKKIRGLAWTVIKWAKQARPDRIFLENVREFEEWGPLDKGGLPIKSRRGETFKRWVRALRNEGYVVEWRVLRACDFGAPTTRERLYVIARRDGKAIRWPEPTHGPGLRPYVPASSCIDWSIPGQSIFTRTRPLAEATMFRIAEGMRRYVFGAGDGAFVVRTGHYSHKTGAGRTMRGQRLNAPLGTVCAGVNEKALIQPWVMKYYGGVVGNPITVPLDTITQIDHHAIVSAYLTKFYGTSTGSSLNRPMPTVTAGGSHIGLVRAFLTKYYGAGGTAQSLNEPIHTITTKARMGIVEVHGEDWQIADITLRMLEPHELAKAQGFPEGYVLTGTKANQIAKIGNSVVPLMAELIVGANQ